MGDAENIAVKKNQGDRKGRPYNDYDGGNGAFIVGATLAVALE